VKSRILSLVVLWAVALICGGVVRAQEAPVPSQQPPSEGAPAEGAPATTVATTSAATSCVQPAPLLELQDYDGPLKKTVGLFARKLDRRAVHPPHYQPGLILCALGVKDKFSLFVHDTLDPVTFITAGFIAGLDQAENNDPSFGQGAAGYGKRLGVDYLDQASFNFFQDFAYPAIFSEDPRYYRLIHASGKRRLWHAVNHSFVAYRYNGDRMFNVSEWLGTTSVVALGNLYHPGNARGFAPAATQVSIDVLQDMGFDVLREFWPEIARALHLPFRAEPAPPNSGANPFTG
jgi:hypothetical protein